MPLWLLEQVPLEVVLMERIFKVPLQEYLLYRLVVMFTHWLLPSLLTINFLPSIASIRNTTIPTRSFTSSMCIRSAIVYTDDKRYNCFAYEGWERAFAKRSVETKRRYVTYLPSFLPSFLFCYLSIYLSIYLLIYMPLYLSFFLCIYPF